MAEPQKTKGVDKDDGGKPTRPTIEAERQAEELSTAGHLARYVKQDLEDGADDDHLSILKQYEDEGKPEHQIFDVVKKGAVGKVDKLLSRDAVSSDCRDSHGRTPLIVAAEAGNAALVGVLIRHHASVNVVDPDGQTAMMKAAFEGHLSVVELLAENGADLGMRNNDGSTALEIAQLMKRDAVVAFLSAQSPDSTSCIKAETSTDPDDDGPSTDGPVGATAAAAAAMVPSPDAQERDENRGSNAISGVTDSSDFEPQKESETSGNYQENPDAAPTLESGSHPAAVEPLDEAQATIPRPHDAILENKTGTRPALPQSVLAASEKRIEYDALDNKQIRGINEKVIKVLDKAGKEVGDYVIDTVFKGNYLAVLKPRSQENKRWRKLKQHPELVIDPKRATELTGGCAARRLCLAEGKDISHLTISHFIELYYAKDPKLILTLAEDAVIHNYTVRQLKKAVEELREHKDDHDPGKEIIRTLDQPVPILEDPDLMALCTDKHRVLDELSKAERRKIRALIKARKPGLDDWKNLMDTFEGILSDLEND
jgi:hypothetical protein